MPPRRTQGSTHRARNPGVKGSKGSPSTTATKRASADRASAGRAKALGPKAIGRQAAGRRNAPPSRARNESAATRSRRLQPSRAKTTSRSPAAGTTNASRIIETKLRKTARPTVAREAGRGSVVTKKWLKRGSDTTNQSKVSSERFVAATSNTKHSTQAAVKAAPRPRKNSKSEASVEPTYTIAIVGRPNVGKSTFFNRLITPTSARSITHGTPGITRDYKVANAKLINLNFKLIDTAGFGFYLDKKQDDLNKRIDQQTEAAIKLADLILFVVDSRDGLVPHDKAISAWLRKQSMPIILVVNKCENDKLAAVGANEFSGLHHQEMCAISAEHGLGLSRLHDLLSRYVPLTVKALEIPTEAEETESEIEDETEASGQDKAAAAKSGKSQKLTPKHNDSQSHTLRIAILGRPNVGKSTLINALIGQNRLITGAEAGITRDPIAIDLEYKGKHLQLMDTAGVRRRNKVENTVEKLSVQKALEAMSSCHIVALVVDINNPLERQDLKLASVVAQRGSKPIIVVVNKADSVPLTKELKSDVEHLVQNKITQGGDITILYVSALKKQNINKILDEAIRLDRLRGKRIPTSELNEWLAKAIDEHQLSLASSGRRLKIKFMNQVHAFPPTFQIFMSNPDALPDSYLRYLTSSLKAHFGLLKVPINIRKVQTINPYGPKDGE